MAAGANPVGEPAAAPELSDTYARIRLHVNPYSASAQAEKKIAAPAGFTWAGRLDRNEHIDGSEGVTEYVLGSWAPNDGSFKLTYTPNKGAVAYGIVLEIEARKDRADAVFNAMNLAVLKGMLR